jgi:hypothetical protein
MTAVTALQLTNRPRRIDPIAAAWGGLVGGIGLVVAGPRELTIRIGIVIVVGIVAGFLTGMRAIRHRVLNAFAAWVAANIFYLVFVLAANLVHGATGRGHAPALAPGGLRTWGIVTAISLVATIAGGMIANALLRPAGRRSNYS